MTQRNSSALSRRGMLRRSAIGLTAALGGFSGCSSSDSGQQTTATKGTVVEVGPGGDYTFVPGTDEPLRVSAGTTVEWVWKSDAHNIVVGSQPDGANWEGTPGGSSKTYDEGYTYTHTFEVTGKYHYWCQPHKSLGMVADLIVE